MAVFGMQASCRAPQGFYQSHLRAQQLLSLAAREMGFESLLLLIEILFGFPSALAGEEQFSQRSWQSLPGTHSGGVVEGIGRHHLPAGGSGHPAHA